MIPAYQSAWCIEEALACGTPVIVSRGAGVHEVLEGRSGVSVVGPGEPGAIAAAIRRRRAYPDPLGVERTRAWIRRELTNARYAEAMEAIIGRAGARRLPESSRAGSSESSPPAAPGRLAPTHSPPA